MGTDCSFKIVEEIVPSGSIKCAFEWCTRKRGRTSSFRAECEAYEDALVWMGTSTTREDGAIVLTDSLSLVSRLQAGKVKDSWVHLIDKFNAPFKTVYTPGNAGITYNDAADHLV